MRERVEILKISKMSIVHNIRWVLDCQKPWSSHLITGKKSAETRYRFYVFFLQNFEIFIFTQFRSYALPKELIDVPVLVMETHRGPYAFDKVGYKRTFFFRTKNCLLLVLTLSLLLYSKAQQSPFTHIII